MLLLSASIAASFPVYTPTREREILTLFSVSIEEPISESESISVSVCARIPRHFHPETIATFQVPFDLWILQKLRRYSNEQVLMRSTVQFLPFEKKATAVAFRQMKAWATLISLNNPFYLYKCLKGNELRNVRLISFTELNIRLVNRHFEGHKSTVVSEDFLST